MPPKIPSPSPRVAITTLALAAALAVMGVAAVGWVDDAEERGSVGESGAESAVYYLNRNQQESGDHEVHREDCRYLPAPRNRLRLGRFARCRDALEEARERGYPTADGCYLCAPACNTG